MLHLTQQYRVNNTGLIVHYSHCRVANTICTGLFYPLSSLLLTGFKFKSLVRQQSGLSKKRVVLQLNSLYVGFSLRVLNGFVFLQNMSSCLGSSDAFWMNLVHKSCRLKTKGSIPRSVQPTSYGISHSVSQRMIFTQPFCILSISSFILFVMPLFQTETPNSKIDLTSKHIVKL